MKFVADTTTAKWIQSNPPFEWDAGNSTKSEKKHGFSIEQIESMFASEIVFAGRIIEPAHEEDRYLLIGKIGEKIVTLVFTRRGQLLRPISCRAARPNEKELYDA
jgi:uncharacterized DUF497 family protein